MAEKLIMIVEDDPDDSEFLIAALQAKKIQMNYLCFQNGEEALAHLHATKNETFLIISDINMPLMNGLEFKRKINSDTKLRDKNIPFIFLSTSAKTNLVNEAFALSIQGYFQKPNNISQMNKLALSIIDYWSSSEHPVA